MNVAILSGINTSSVYAEICTVGLNVDDGVSLEVIPTQNAYGIVFRPYNETTSTILNDYEMINSRQIIFNSGVSLGDEIFIQYFLNQ